MTLTASRKDDFNSNFGKNFYDHQIFNIAAALRFIANSGKSQRTGEEVAKRMHLKACDEYSFTRFRICKQGR